MRSRVSITLPDALLRRVESEATAQKTNRSRFIERALDAYLAGRTTETYAAGDTEVLRRDIEHAREIVAMREADIVILSEREGVAVAELRDTRAELRECNKRLLRYQLPAPKVPRWREHAWQIWRKRRPEAGV